MNFPSLKQPSAFFPVAMSLAALAGGGVSLTFPADRKPLIVNTGGNGERIVRNDEVVGSSPTSSTKITYVWGTHASLSPILQRCNAGHEQRFHPRDYRHMCDRDVLASIYYSLMNENCAHMSMIACWRITPKVPRSHIKGEPPG